MATPPPPSAPKLPPGAKLPAKPPGTVQMPKLPAGMDIPRQTINVGAALGAARLTTKAPAAPVGGAPAPGGVINPNLKVTQGKIKKETMRISLPPKPGSQPGKPLSAFGGAKPPSPSVPRMTAPGSQPPPPKPPGGSLSNLNVTRPLVPGAEKSGPEAKPAFKFPAPPAKLEVTETKNIQSQEEPTAVIPGTPEVKPKPKPPMVPKAPAVPPKPSAGMPPKVSVVPPKPAPPKPSVSSATKPLAGSAGPVPMPPKPPVPVVPKPSQGLQSSGAKVPLPETDLKSSSEDVRAKTSVIKPPAPSVIGGGAMKPPAPQAPQAPSGKRATKPLAMAAKSPSPQMPTFGGSPAPKPPARKPLAPAPLGAKNAPGSSPGGVGKPPAPAGKQPVRTHSAAPVSASAGGGTGLAIAAGIISLISAAVVFAGLFDVI